MEGITHVNLLRKGNNVYLQTNSKIICIGTLGRQGALVEKLRNTTPSPHSFFLKSRLKSKRIVRKGYLPLPKSELRSIFNSYRTRVSKYSIILDGLPISYQEDL
ncbi:hypothetical protein GOV13_05410 [Candidatus Pacearchaeota archaeon]|nr:hypothetical protein [Candidatus Pacearchaeota archaeon]